MYLYRGVDRSWTCVRLRPTLYSNALQGFCLFGYCANDASDLPNMSNNMVNSINNVFQELPLSHLHYWDVVKI